MLKTAGFDVVHFAAPGKLFYDTSYSGPSYKSCVMSTLASAHHDHKNVVFDRSHYGELVWPIVYGRKPLLTPDDVAEIREHEQGLYDVVKRVLMIDPAKETHWRRCLLNNEPLTREQFDAANDLYINMAQRHGFKLITYSPTISIEELITNV